MTERAGVVAAMAAQRHPRRLLRRRLAWALGLLAGGLLVATGVAFLQVQASTTTPITAGSSLPGGAAVDITAVSNTVTIARGRAEQIAGVELYRIAIADAAESDHLTVNFSWLNPQDADQVLSNPNAWIGVGIYYNSGTAPSGNACPQGEYLLNDPVDGRVCVLADTGFDASTALTAERADALLMSSESNESVAYIVASINTPGHAPPGQQGQLTTLEYNIEAQVH